MSEIPVCQSCGMPMKDAADFGGGLLDNACCAHCCDDAGNLKTREEVRSGMIALAMRTTGVSGDEAAQTVDRAMAAMPAWSVMG